MDTNKADAALTDHEATASDSPFIQGRNARLYGKPASQCPYPEGSPERALWLEAFAEDGPASTAGVDEAGRPA